MSQYVLGGWAQSLSAKPPQQFSYAMYGMVTNLTGLTTGTPTAPGWSPAQNKKPDVGGSVLWTYGGGGCTPRAMPANEREMEAIVAATRGWDGLDVDDECAMNIDNLITVMSKLKPKQTSYTFLAGYDYNNPANSSIGTAANNAVAAMAQSGVCDRFALMCYAAAMWSMSDIKANVGPAIERTLAKGIPAKSIMLALTPKGLDQENLDYFLDQVTDKDIGGLFIWSFPTLKSTDLDTITRKLNIGATRADGAEETA